MILPLKLVWKVQVPLRQKISIGVVICLALVCIAIATVRVVEVGRTLYEHSFRVIIWLILWSIIESSIGKAVLTLGSPKH